MEEESIQQAEELNNELKNLREKKSKELSQENNKKQPKSNIIKGYISSIKNRKSSVLINVDFYDEKEKTKSFSLDKPTNPEDYKNDNELLCFIKKYGDESTVHEYDITKLMHRKVHLRKNDANYELIVPSDLSISTMTKQKIREKLTGMNIIKWDTQLTDILHSTKSRTIAGLLLITYGLINLSTLSLMPMPWEEIMWSMSFGVLIFFFANYIITGAIHVFTKGKFENYMIDIFIITTVLMSVLLAQYSYINEITRAISISSYILITALGILSFYSMKDVFRSKFSDLKNKINKKRGIEHVK